MYCEHVIFAGGLMVEYSTSEHVIRCPPSPVSPRIEQTVAKTAQARERLTVTRHCLHEICVRGEVIHPLPPSELSERLQYAVAVSNSISNRKKRRNGGRKGSQDQDVGEQ